VSPPLLDEVRARLGFHKLSPVWAKVEIVLGLLAAGLGLFVGLPAASRPPEDGWPLVAAGLALFVLGGSLTLAGHRSHLYQASLERLALLVEEVRRGNNAPLPGPQTPDQTRATGGDVV